MFEKVELDANSFWEGLALVTCLKVWDLVVAGNCVALIGLEGSEGSQYKDNILLGIGPEGERMKEEWRLASSFSNSTC